MKTRILVLFFLFLSIDSRGQDTYTINGESLELNSEISGTLDLLWNIIDGKYRYFVRKNGEILELTNTRDESGKYSEEYKSILSEMTSGSGLSTDKIKLTLYSLSSFINDYNAEQDPNYIIEEKGLKLGSRIMVFGGITNSPFVENPDNINNPVFGFEYEVYAPKEKPRHSILFQLKHSARSKDFEYSNTQLALGYRFRFVSRSAFDIYGTVLGATYNFIKAEETVADMVFDTSSNEFEAPFIFGIGADIKISENGFITLVYDELFALSLENQGNFSTHITVGYKVRF
jgi:hypothetical protein